MMGCCRIAGAILLAVVSAVCSAPALAVPLEFDCDVPPNHFSSISASVSVPIGIKGSVKAVEFRSGSYLPIAGLKIESPDSKNVVGFQLIANSVHAKYLDIIVNVQKDGELRQYALGRTDASIDVNFLVSSDVNGSVHIKIAEEL